MIFDTAEKIALATTRNPFLFCPVSSQHQTMLLGRQANVNVSEKLTRLVAELPVEILGEIFIHCLPDLICGKRENSPTSHQAPMLLCQVCVRWRQIALEMPMLWSSLSTRTSSRRDLYRHISLMKLWLERSQECALSLDLMGSELDDIRGLLNKTFPVFISEVNRWKKINLYLNPAVCEQFLAVTPGIKPQLEKITLHVLDCSTKQVNQLPIVLNKFTQLRQLIIHHSFMVPLLGLHWTSLTHIELHTPLPLDRCVSILTECSDILEIKLTDIREPVASIPHSKIDLPTLMKLELVSDCVDVGEILSYITCPALRDLAIDHSLAIDTREPYYLNDFLDRSSCKLHSLALKHDYASEVEILGYISSSALRSLRSLLLYSWGTRDEALATLKCTQLEDGALKMPFLEKVDLEVGDVSDGLLSDVLSSRIGPEALNTKSPLKSFRIRFLEAYPPVPHRGYCSGAAVRESHKCDVERFREFCGHGVYISYIFGC